MKRRLTWFIIGFVASWLTWSTIAFLRARPRDITASWQTEIMDSVSSLFPWMKSARGIRAGQYVVWTPADKNNASAIIFPKTGAYPQFLITDEDANGVLDQILIFDSQFTSIDVDDQNEDTLFDTHGYSTGIGTNSVSFTDRDMDGFYNFILGPGRRIRVSIDCAWYDLIRTNGQQYVMVNDRMRRVTGTNGVWTFLDESISNKQIQATGDTLRDSPAPDL